MSLLNVIKISLEGQSGRAAKEILNKEKILSGSIDYESLEEALAANYPRESGESQVGMSIIHIDNYSYSCILANARNPEGWSAQIYPIEALHEKKETKFLGGWQLMTATATTFGPATGPKAIEMIIELEQYVKELGLDYQLISRAMNCNLNRRDKMATAINIQDKISKLKEAWSPVDLAKVNEQVVRLALFKGEYHWHSHSTEDELIFVHKGRIVVQFKDRRNIELNSGELTVIPKGVEHCPKSLEDSYILMFEPISLKSQGN